MYKVLMKKGSPEGYNAETGLSQPTWKPNSGEPNERHSSYRIRRPQEECKLLRQDRRRPHCRRGQAALDSLRTASVGGSAHRAVAGRDGSYAVQRLDIRRTEALRGSAAGRPSRADAGDRRIE